MVGGAAPPGLSGASSDGETSTHGRERRRVAMVAREVLAALSIENQELHIQLQRVSMHNGVLAQKLDVMDGKFDALAQMTHGMDGKIDALMNNKQCSNDSEVRHTTSGAAQQGRDSLLPAAGDKGDGHVATMVQELESRARPTRGVPSAEEPSVIEPAEEPAEDEDFIPAKQAEYVAMVKSHEQELQAMKMAMESMEQALKELEKNKNGEEQAARGHSEGLRAIEKEMLLYSAELQQIKNDADRKFEKQSEVSEALHDAHLEKAVEICNKISELEQRIMQSIAKQDTKRGVQALSTQVPEPIDLDAQPTPMPATLQPGSSQAASAHVSSTEAEEKAESSDSSDSDEDESRPEIGSYEQLLFFRRLKAACRPGEFGADWPLQELEKKYRGRSEPAS